MKDARMVRNVIVAAALFAAAIPSFAQGEADTGAAVVDSPVAGRALTDHVPVVPSVLDRAWAVDPGKGVETRAVADGVFVVTDGVWQSAFVVTDAGVVVIDAPERYGGKIRSEIAAVTPRPITTLIYTHAHNDHIGGSAAFADVEGLEIVALDCVAEFLAEKNDPDRLTPTRTFEDQLVLEPGGTRIELRSASYHSDEGDVILYLPQARFLMAIDTLAPGYAPFMGFEITSSFQSGSVAGTTSTSSSHDSSTWSPPARLPRSSGVGSTASPGSTSLPRTTSGPR